MTKAHPYPYHVLDVFTSERFSGNPLAVVLNADDMPGAAMQKVAREFNLSETIFVMAPDADEHEARVRIFTPRYEMAFAGHPTVGCAIFLAERHWPKGKIDETLVLEEQAGLVPVHVRRDHGPMEATFAVPIVPQPTGTTVDRGDAAAALDLSVDDLLPHAVAEHEGGPTFTFVGLKTLEALGRARPVEPLWSSAMATGTRDSTFLYVEEEAGRYRTRMFAPLAGIPEDPATGSASAILASQLLSEGELSEGTTMLTLQQGVEMGRPSEIAVEIDVADASLVEVRVMGRAIRVADGQVLV